jgi:hypothetical protein
MATRPDRRVKAAKKPVVPKKRGRGAFLNGPLSAPRCFAHGLTGTGRGNA